MSDASIEIIPSRDDENVNLMNFVPSSPTNGDAGGGAAAADKPLSPKGANSTVSTNANGIDKFLAYTAAKLGSQNSLVESLKRGPKIGGLTTPKSSSLSTGAYASLMRTSEIDSKFLALSTSTPSSMDKENDATNPPAWYHPKSPPSSSNLKSPDDISKFGAVVSPVREDLSSVSNEMDEIMAFRANSSDSYDTVEAVDSSAISHENPPTERPEDCLSIESMRVLPTIMESKSQETAEDNIVDILSHPGTECGSVNSDVSGNNAEGSIEVLDDGSISIVGLALGVKATIESPKNKLNLKVAVTPDKAEEIDDLNQMLDDLSKDPCDESPISPLFSPLAGENILASPRFDRDLSSPKQNNHSRGAFSPRQSEVSTSPRAALSPRRQPEASTSPRAVLAPIQIGKPTSPRGIPSPRDVHSPRGIRSPKKSTDMSTLRGILSYVKSDLSSPSADLSSPPATPSSRLQQHSKITSPKLCRDPPSQLEVNEKIANHRFTVNSTVAKASQLKEDLEMQMSRTQEFSAQVMTKREGEVKRQSELENEMKEVARHNDALQAEIKKLEATKADIEKTRRDVEKETAELEQLKKEHFSRCDELEKELILENQALRDDIERLISTKKELAEAKYKAEKEKSDLQKLQKEYEIQLQVLETEKQKLGEAMDRATAETSEINELSRTTLIELSRHKKSVEADMIIVRENHDSSLKVAFDEKEKLQAATIKAEQETKEAKEHTARILHELQTLKQTEEATVASLRKEHDTQMQLLEKEKEALVKATEEAANQTTETKEMTRTVLSELEEYKVKLEVDMQNETKDLKAEIRR